MESGICNAPESSSANVQHCTWLGFSVRASSGRSSARKICPGVAIERQSLQATKSCAKGIFESAASTLQHCTWSGELSGRGDKRQRTVVGCFLLPSDLLRRGLLHPIVTGGKTNYDGHRGENRSTLGACCVRTGKKGGKTEKNRVDYKVFVLHRRDVDV